MTTTFAVLEVSPERSSVTVTVTGKVPGRVYLCEERTLNVPSALATIVPGTIAEPSPQLIVAEYFPTGSGVPASLKVATTPLTNARSSVVAEIGRMVTVRPSATVAVEWATATLPAPESIVTVTGNEPSEGNVWSALTR